MNGNLSPAGATRVPTSKAADSPDRYAFVLADLDHFKSLNDNHGHEAGDRALRVFGEVLQRCLRDTDLAARCGGEEFAFVIPEALSREGTGPRPGLPGRSQARGPDRAPPADRAQCDD